MTHYFADYTPQFVEVFLGGVPLDIANKTVKLSAMPFAEAKEFFVGVLSSHLALRRCDLACLIAGEAGQGYSAACSGAMRRLWRACSLYSLCHSVGPLDGATCTAVTLYSGQLVAQSEKSVVITLACVSGWWKVV